MYICPSCGSTKILQELVLMVSANTDPDENLDAFERDIESALNRGEYTDFFTCDPCGGQINPINDETGFNVDPEEEECPETDPSTENLT